MNTTSTEHLTHMYAHTYAQEITQNTYTPANTYTCTENNNTHIFITSTQTQKQTICTQPAHNMHTHKQNNMQHIHINTEQDNTEQHIDTETNNPAQDNAQPQHRCSTYDLHTYSFDLYHEQIYIKNSNTIEIYTILK